MSHLVGFVDWSLAELTGRKDELITDPPLSQLMIFAGTSEGGLIVNGRVAVLRVRGGIRVLDLRECFEMMMHSGEFQIRLVPFRVLGQQMEDGRDDDGKSSATGTCFFDLDEYNSEHRRRVSRRYPRVNLLATPQWGAQRHQRYGSEPGEGYLASGFPENEYEWSYGDRLEDLPSRRQDDGSEFGEDRLESGVSGDEYERNCHDRLRDWSDDGEYGEDDLGGEAAGDGYGWYSQNELEGWSRSSQGNDSESGKGGFASDDSQDGYEWNFYDELEEWSKLA